jgi:hypothetical protein
MPDQTHSEEKPEVNMPASGYGEIGSYVRLQHQIHDALREQHPEWIQPNGDCPNCESYESRFAELLDLFRSNGGKSAASSKQMPLTKGKKHLLNAVTPHRLERTKK